MGGSRGFAALWAARTASLVGSQVSVFAVPMFLYDSGASPSVLGAALVAKSVPVLLAPVTGVLADRVDPRRVVVACDLAQVAVVGAIAVLLPPPAVLVPLLALSGLLGTVFLPAGKAAVPRLVPVEGLGRANSLLGVSANVAVAVGPLLGAAAYALGGPRAAFAADAGTFLLSALLLLLVPRLPPVRTGTRAVADLRAGFSYVAGHRAVRTVAVGLLVGVAFAAIDDVALTYLVRDELAAPPAVAGVALSAFGVGMVAVPVVLLALLARRRISGTALLAAGLLVSAAGLAATGLAGGVVVAVVAYGVAGAGNGLENIGTDTAVGEQVPPELLGRVFGAVYAPLAGGGALAYAAAGPLVEATSARTAFVVAGAGCAGAALLVALLGRSGSHPVPGNGPTVGA